jgi:hypothetical protein
VAYGSPPDDAEYGWQDIAVFDIRHIEHVLGQDIATPVPAAITITFTAPCADSAPFTSHPLPSSVAAFQGGNGAGDDDAADTGDLAQTEMLGEDGVAEDG